MAATETSARANAVLDELYREHVGRRVPLHVRGPGQSRRRRGRHADDVRERAARARAGRDPRGPVALAHGDRSQPRPAAVAPGGRPPDARRAGDGCRWMPRRTRRHSSSRSWYARSSGSGDAARGDRACASSKDARYREIATVMGLSTSALETLLFRARRSLAEELENVVTCQNAELALSKSIDGRLSRKERRRLDEHLADCPDCARLAATQQRRRRAFKGLALLPLLIGLALFKGAPSAAAATRFRRSVSAPPARARPAPVRPAQPVRARPPRPHPVERPWRLARGRPRRQGRCHRRHGTVATGVGYKGVDSVRHAPPRPAGRRRRRPQTGAPKVAIAPGEARGRKKAQIETTRHGKPGVKPGPREARRSASSPASRRRSRPKAPGTMGHGGRPSGSRRAGRLHGPDGWSAAGRSTSTDRRTRKRRTPGSAAAPKGGGGTQAGDGPATHATAGNPRRPGRRPASGRPSGAAEASGAAGQPVRPARRPRPSRAARRRRRPSGLPASSPSTPR